jgi:sulfoquinovosidase
VTEARLIAPVIGAFVVLAAVSLATGPRAPAVADDVLVVTADGVRAEIRQDPFGMRFLDRDGDEVVRSVDNDLPPPTPLAPLPDHPPLGAEVPDQPPLYAPVTFTVGEQVVGQFPGGFWSADLLVGAASGVQHNLERVEAFERSGGGFRLIVSTNDPTGREALVTVTPDEGPMLKVSVRFDDTDGVGVVAASFGSVEGEAFHGFGGRRNTTDQRGERFYNWIEEFAQLPEETGASEDLPTSGDNYQFPTGPQGTYYAQSTFISSHGYGFWLDRDEVSKWRMAYDRDDAWHVAVAADGLDLTIAPGAERDAIAALTAATGRNPLVPRWALGPMVSRAVESLDQEPEEYEELVRADLEAVERYDLPLTAFSIEGWPMLEEREALDEILAWMDRLDLRPVGYVKAFVGGSQHTEREGKLQDAIERGIVAETAAGTPYLFGSPVEIWEPAALLDVTDPDMVAYWRDRIREHLDMGFEGFMQDFGEQTFWDMHFHDGSTGVEMHNRYPVVWHRLTKEVFDEYVREHPDREPWFFVRAGYSGRPGSAAYELTNWGGDNTADWSRSSGLGSVVPDMLNRGIGGAYGYATDIGGYVDTFGEISSELFLRWAQLGSLIPVNRVHGGPVHGTHVPWRFGDDVVEHYRDTIERHIAAQPLIHGLWAEAVETGMPIARPLWLHHPDDDRARVEEQQWLLGPDVLVAPVIEEGARTRDVYFPQGCWEHPETGESFNGPREVTVDAPVELLPYFFRCGTEPFPVPSSDEEPLAGEGDQLTAAPLPATGAPGPVVLAAILLLAGGGLRARWRRGERQYRERSTDSGRSRRSGSRFR